MKKLVLIFIAILSLNACSFYGDKMTFNGTDVYYKGGVTKTEATKLGNYLVASEFTDGNAKSVQLVRNKENNRLTFRMVVNEDAANSTANDTMFELFAMEISKEFNEPVDFETCDSRFKTIKTFYSENRQKIMKSNATDVLYSPNVSEEIAQKTADFLIKYGYSNNDPKTVSIDKINDTYIFKSVVRPGTEKDESSLAIFTLLRDVMKDSVFGGKNLEWHLSDDKLNTIKILD